jgi:hypothetical protein
MSKLEAVVRLADAKEEPRIKILGGCDRRVQTRISGRDRRSDLPPRLSIIFETTDQYRER